MEQKVYTTTRSNGIMAIYWSTIVFFLFMMIGVPFFAEEEMKDGEEFIFYIVFAILLVFFSWIIYRIYTMKYVIENDEVVIHGAFNVNRLKIFEIESIQRTPIPYGIRLYGGSFIGGRYYLPGIGKAWVAMTNFKDGVLIKSRSGENYVITPKNPDSFVEFINSLRPRK